MLRNEPTLSMSGQPATLRSLVRSSISKTGASFVLIQFMNSSKEKEKEKNSFEKNILEVAILKNKRFNYDAKNL